MLLIKGSLKEWEGNSSLQGQVVKKLERFVPALAVKVFLSIAFSEKGPSLAES